MRPFPIAETLDLLSKRNGGGLCTQLFWLPKPHREFASCLSLRKEAASRRDHGCGPNTGVTSMAKRYRQDMTMDEIMRRWPATIRPDARSCCPMKTNNPGQGLPGAVLRIFVSWPMNLNRSSSVLPSRPPNSHEVRRLALPRRGRACSSRRGRSARRPTERPGPGSQAGWEAGPLEIRLSGR